MLDRALLVSQRPEASRAIRPHHGFPGRITGEDLLRGVEKEASTLGFARRTSQSAVMAEAKQSSSDKPAPTGRLEPSIGDRDLSPKTAGSIPIAFFRPGSDDEKRTQARMIRWGFEEPGRTLRTQRVLRATFA